MTLYQLEKMFPTEIQTRIEANPTLVLPFGTVEWHSHHLPVGLDGLVADGICRRAAELADAVLAPVSYWAVGGVPYPYTLNLPIDIIEPLLVAVFEQFGAMGFKVIVPFTGHFGLDQTLTIKRAALTVMDRSPVTILPLTEYDLVTDIYPGDHAAVGETSLLWTLYPDLVRLDAVPADEPLDGIIGTEPRGAASAAMGESVLQTIAARMAEVSRRLLRETGPLQRVDFIEAVRAGVKVLAKTSQQRQTMPKKDVPSISTPAYLAYCQAIYAGDYRQAKSLAEKKYANLAE
ncbi:MAG: creatininase family protein [Anaerolineales bacterium]|nr:creatininase family protein [Anaerolineales bacterium]